MLGCLGRLRRQPFMLLVLLSGAVSLSLKLYVSASSSEGASGSEIPRGPAPHTMSEHEVSRPLLQSKTLFVVDNEPVLESHIVSNLLHQLLFSLGVPQQHIRLRDEAFLLGSRQVRHAAASLGRWLAIEAETIPEGVEFVFVCSAYTRIDPATLEALLTELKKGAKMGALGPFILGWGLVDEKSTIIHHFKEAKSQMYPHLDAGTVWSRAAFLTLKKAIQETPPAPSIERDFPYELAEHLEKTQQLQLIHSELFCPVPPAIDNYERAHSTYPAPHTRPRNPPGSESSSEARKRELTAAERAADAAATRIADIHKGCVSFASGSKHAPVLSHHIFDALIDFDEELMVKRELLEGDYSEEEKLVEGGAYQKARDELETTRPSFIVEPQDLMVAIKTHGQNHATRLPLLRRLWASPEALVEQAKKHSAASHHEPAAAKEEERQLKETYSQLSLRFFSDTADPKRGIEASQVKGSSADGVGSPPPAGKGVLCLRLQHIFREFMLTPEVRRFLLITDDDTLLNFRHMLDLLSLTLQPTIPARGFVANLLSDNQGYRAHSPKYKALAEQIRRYLKTLAASADVVEGDIEPKQEPGLRPKYTSEHLTGASTVYGRGSRRAHENMSPLYLGERYAFGLTAGTKNQGYDYVTMGGGAVLDRQAVQLLLRCIDSSECTCPSNGTADDMMLGIWAKRLNIPLVHARGLHQERPKDYHPLLIETLTPISFHRMSHSAKETKRIFSEYVDIGEYSGHPDDTSNGELLNPDYLLEIDWVDHDWHHAEEHLWLEREELHEMGDDDLPPPRGIGDILSRNVARGTRPMTPEELLEHEELEAMSLHDEL